ncbi:MAG: phenylalanine--tRNA ligase subunit beta, partial [Lachnospiraceae bacterium]|nr:phenylalanine--tRNA ligase subunit beta [Lachnospiraceae bacterium]
ESTYIAVLDLKDVVARASLDVKYTPIVNLPLVNRDISLVVKENVTHAQIESIIRAAGGEHLENVALFDIYVGEKIQKGYKSMAYSISFRGKEKTLTEDEITGAMNNVIEALAKNDIVLRTE